MAVSGKKKKTAVRRSGQGQTARSKAVVPKVKPESEKSLNEIFSGDAYEPRDGLALHIMPFIIAVFAIYFFVVFIFFGQADGESVGGFGLAVRNLFFGLFSYVSYLIPFMMLWTAFTLRKDYMSGFLKFKIIFTILCLMFYSSFIHLISSGGTDFDMRIMFSDGGVSVGGGAVGGFIANSLRRIVGSFGAGLFIISLSLVFSTYMFGITPMTIIRFFIRLADDHRKNREQYYKREIQIKHKATDPKYKTKTSKYTITSHMNAAKKDDEEFKKNHNPDIPIENRKIKISDRVPKIVDNPYADSSSQNSKKQPEITIFPENDVFNEVKKEESGKIAETLSHGEADKVDGANKKIEFKNKEQLDNIFDNKSASEGYIDYDNAFSDGELIDSDEISVDELAGEFDDGPSVSLESVTSHPVRRDDEPELTAENKVLLPVEVKKMFGEEAHNAKEYRFPPISFLTKDTAAVNVDVSEELNATAQKLVETLASFGVRTKIQAYSRGPTITRYEISPNTGVKVRSIVNLVDDISLNLATGGVRIEAPIPGKSAVGVEVPNKIVSTVHLRSLLEEPKFEQAESKVTVVLGTDVAGNAIYSDIAKMPHLLIAGATGMGKSVCINSIITSMLYKARPDEVKLILIDPKKVELNIYNGTPHLLIPVVSDPKKAAGSLAWAVSEMENRFILIEERGVRDLKAYNEIIKNDPSTDPLPQIVIIIDELADLMMTAPADVEQSICRLAQKARAAGMHLIIGTQRPSVDVITGLIKANIPSRIAFTVASQIDSRTIIDIGGAEKLIGRGDMLYQPVGAKPIRVQGAYVSEKDVLSVIDFLRKQSDGSYDENILNQIEMEAQRCNTKGAKLQSKDTEMSNEEEMEKEPALKPAIEIAIETGRISTTLLQTRLSLGYARAARIIDKLEKMNIIGPFEGSKPRKVLITKQDFIEMTMKGDFN